MQRSDWSGWRWLTLVVGGVAMVSALTAGRPQAAKPVPNPTAAVTFADREGDDFRSDFSVSGSHTYANGADGSGGSIDGGFYVGGSEDLTLNLIRSARKYFGTYTFVKCPGGSTDRQTCGGIPDGQFFDGWFLNIHKIADMLPGTTRWTVAGFSAAFGQRATGRTNPRYDTVWTFFWCNDGAAYPLITPLPNGCGDAQPDGQVVSVTRSANDPTTNQPSYTWLVSADPIPDTPVGDMSELRELTKTGTINMHGFYKTRFQLMVTCTSGCSQLPH